MPTLDSGSVSLSRSARGDSVQTIWLVGRHSVLFTLDTTVLRCVTVAPLVVFLLAYLFDTFWSLRVTLHDHSLLAFVLWLAWGIIGYVVSGKSGTFSFIVSIGVENALLVLDCTESLPLSLVSVSKVRMCAWIFSGWMHSCAAVLFEVQCRLFTHDTFFVCQIARRVLRY